MPELLLCLTRVPAPAPDGCCSLLSLPPPAGRRRAPDDRQPRRKGWRGAQGDSDRRPAEAALEGAPGWAAADLDSDRARAWEGCPAAAGGELGGLDAGAGAGDDSDLIALAAAGFDELVRSRAERRLRAGPPCPRRADIRRRRVAGCRQAAAGLCPLLVP